VEAELARHRTRKINGL